METYKDLHVWQNSIALVLLIYQITECFPDQEKFGLVNQMRRAAISISSNIAEGHARKGDIEFKRFLRIAYGSCAELETQLLISKKLEFLSESDFVKVEAHMIIVKKMLNKLMSTLVAKS